MYVFARGPVGGFSGVYLPVRTPELWEQISAGNEIGKQKIGLGLHQSKTV